MAKLVWDQVGEKTYETGVYNGVLYKETSGVYTDGVVWNGLTAVTESPSGAEPTPLYADNQKYLNLMSVEEFGATIEAYTYPKEWEEFDGSASITEGVIIGQQTRKTFGLAYKTILGNDVDQDSYGYKIHLIYGALASPTEKGYTTVSDTPDAMTFSWTVTTTPVMVEGFKPTALLTINSKEVEAEGLAALEKVLFGDTETEPRLPLPLEVKAIIDGN